MTTFERLEGDLPMLLEELAPPRTPDYLEDAFGRTAGARQRRAWTFPGRWLPASTLITEGLNLPRVPVRTLAILVILLLAVVLAGFVLAGSMRPDLPKPFGVAGNGQVAYSSNNDIFLVDPVTGVSRPITTGPELESAPAFSPDGTLLAFRRVEAGLSIDSYDVVVTAADGSNARTIARLPVSYWSGLESFHWTPDSRSIVVNMQALGELRRYDAMAAAEPRVLATGVTGVDFRPPRGDLVLFRRLDMLGTGLYTMEADGSNVRPLIVIKLDEALGDEDLGSAIWSPDGSKIAFIRTPPGLQDQQHLYLMDADGSNIRELPMGEGTTYATNLSWSPDGTRIAFERFGENGIQPLGVLELATGQVTSAGPQLGDNGVAFEWSPDGRMILAVPGDDPRLIAIDPDDGSSRAIGAGISLEQGVLNDFHPTWQRVTH
jgi:Tol biopolymer transport system component